MPKYDVIIKSSPKDYPKLAEVIKSVRFLNPQPEGIYLINPHGYVPPWYQLIDEGIVSVKDEDVFPDVNRGLISYRPHWCYATFIALFQNITKNDYYLDIQSDNFFINPINLFDENDNPIFFVSPQHEGYHQPYFNFSEKMFDVSRVGDNSFIIEFMMYNKKVSAEMIEMYGSFNRFFGRACEIITDDCYPTEQDLYPNWVLKHHPGMYSVQKNVNTIVLGKHVPDNYSEKEIQVVLKDNFKPDVVAISCHTWNGHEQN